MQEEKLAGIDPNGVAQKPKKERSRAKANDAETKYEEKMLALADIQKDDKFRRRLQEDKKKISEYAEHYREYKEAVGRGENPAYPLEPLLVWWDESRRRYVLLGGYHRIEAALMAGLTEIRVIVLGCV